MADENINQKFRLKYKVETRNYLVDEITKNELVSKKYKNVCIALTYFEHLLVLASAFTG